MDTQFNGKFTATEYSEQVVNGMNYKIKYDTGDLSIIVKVYQPI